MQQGFLNWLFRSAENPEKLSLTIKSSFPLLVAALGLFGVSNFTESELEKGVDALVSILSAVFVIKGLIRKFKKDPTLGGTFSRRVRS